jgi:cytochrome c553
MLIIAVGFGMLPTGHAAIDDLLNKVRVIQNDTATRQQAMRQGKDQAFLCAYCHGKDGNSTKPRIPNLASQDPAYLLDQFERFRLRQREDFTGVMGELVANMSDDDKVALAIYYANSVLKPVVSNLLLAAKGKPVYEKYCPQCHGADGRSKKGYSRISSQQTEYLIETLNLYKDGTDQVLRTRESGIMAEIMNLISAEDIRNIAHYLSSLTVN